MRKLFVLLLLISFTLVAQAQGVRFEEGTLEQAVAKAAKNKKGPSLVFVDCYTTWCGPCKNMTEKVFPQQKVGDFFNANFVNIKIDMEKGEGPALAKKYNVRAFPTFLIIDNKGNEVSRIVGGGDADGFIARVKKAMNPENTPQAKLSAYESNKGYATAFAYLETLQDAYMKEEMNKFLDETFSSFPWYQKFSNEMWPFLNNSLISYKSGIFGDVVKEYTYAVQMLGRDRINNLLTQNIKQYIAAFANGKIENSPVADLQKRLDVLTFVNNGDKLASKLAEIAECIIKNDYSKMGDIYSLYYPGMLSELTYNDRAVAERVLVALKDKLDPNILSLYYRSMATTTKKTAEDYDKLAEPYRKAKAEQTK